MNLKSMKRMKMLAVILGMLAAGLCYSCSAGRQGQSQEILLNEETGGGNATTVETTVSGVSLPAAEESEPPTQAVYFVHVCGQVNAPGVYEMEPGSRIYEAVELAGGFSPEADSQYLNLAQEIADGMKIEVPSTDQVREWAASGQRPAAPGKTAVAGGAGSGTGQNARVNINTAGREDLMTLSGIGESRADDIIRYRETYGPFEQIEDIMNIPGIKDAAFQKIKDSISV